MINYAVTLACTSCPLLLLLRKTFTPLSQSFSNTSVELIEVGVFPDQGALSWEAGPYFVAIFKCSFILEWEIQKGERPILYLLCHDNVNFKELIKTEEKFLWAFERWKFVLE